MKGQLILIAIVIAGVTVSDTYAQEIDLDKAVAQSDLNALPVSLDKVVIRGYDGVAPPPKLKPPARTLFYGYGVTAYYKSTDTLMFFKVLQLEAEHRSPEGEVLARFDLKGSRYNDAFKSYFLNAIPQSERKNIFFKNIYIKDKKGNYFLVEEDRQFCPHCK